MRHCRRFFLAASGPLPARAPEASRSRADGLLSPGSLPLPFPESRQRGYWGLHEAILANFQIASVTRENLKRLASRGLVFHVR